MISLISVCLFVYFSAEYAKSENWFAPNLVEGFNTGQTHDIVGAGPE